MKKHIAYGVLICFCALVISGCSSSRNQVTVHESTSLSKGQELTDLQRALTEGALTDREYETVRKILLDRPY